MLSDETTNEENLDSEQDLSDLNERIRLLIDLKGMQPSRFADEIGVQRSAISHIISGRNKPSVDLLQKIVRRFKEVNLNWIMGQGEEPFADIDSIAQDDLPKASENKLASYKHTAPQTNTENVNKKIEKIVVFYTDKTFETFKS